MAPSSALKDVVIAVGIVGGVLGGLFLYTGVWPPMVVVESGSMMHGVTCPPPANQPELCDPHVGYGKLGTIDPGDMVFVKRVSQRPDVASLAEAAAKNGNERNYGKPGDVVVYFNLERVRGDPDAVKAAKARQTPIIHRAVAYVEVAGVNDPAACYRNGAPATATYRVFWDGRAHDFGNEGIYLPGLFDANYREDDGYKPCWSGFITKGDNPVTNNLPDQAIGGGNLPRQPVELSWIEGKAVGELPWFGLIKLALSGERNYPCSPRDFRPHDPACENGQAPQVLNAVAPGDLWVMLGVSLATISIAPLAYDMYVLRRQKERAEMIARGEDPGPTFGEQVQAWLDAKLRRGGPAQPPSDGAADPREAFEPPPPPPPPQAPPRAPASPPQDPPGPGSGSKFERVQK